MPDLGRIPLLAAHLAALLLLPFLFLGIVGRVKSFWAGRRGPGLLQPWYDWVRLLRKGTVTSTGASFLRTLAPSFVLAATCFAAALVPAPDGQPLVPLAGDFVFFAYALALSRFFLLLAALDTGGAFEGMAASREGLYAALTEPGFFLLLGSFALLAGATDFASLLRAAHASVDSAPLLIVLGALLLFQLLLVEGSRVPVDDPATHLELTMVHEALVLDAAGPDLAFFQYAAALKTVLVGMLCAALLVPADATGWAVLAARVGVVLGLAVAVGLIESWFARLMLSRVPQFLLLLTSIGLALAAGVVLYAVKGG
jgi:formate hydrogenlyase subunit 4